MITIGYGDIGPINMYEKIYVIFMAFFSTAVFGYAIQKIGDIFSEITQKKKLLE